ncbi:hypothetical protein Tco_0939229 [Tanacetum coccineum]|uniref:Uncharacterized protein n=1 Tax=Tanacetum coccineum TaxID=301880 RepID=A0ABQ5DK84_9ASTR
MADDQSVPNPAFTTWNSLDQRAVILLNSSLTKEVAAEVLGLTTDHAIWTALGTAYINSSVEWIHSLRDSLHLKPYLQMSRTNQHYKNKWSVDSIGIITNGTRAYPECNTSTRNVEPGRKDIHRIRLRAEANENIPYSLDSIKSVSPKARSDKTETILDKLSN